MGAAALGGGVLLLLLLAMSGGGAPSPQPSPPGPADDSDLADINDADLLPLICEMLAGAMPFTSSSEFALQVLRGAFVGYDWTQAPAGSERARLLELTTIMVGRVRSGELSCDLPITVDPVPRAGGYYQIQKGDTPLGIIGRAYPWASSGQRVDLVKAVTNHPSNGGGVVGQGIDIATQQPGNIALIGPVIFSMYPRWACNPTTGDQRFAPGNCYAVVFLPLLTGT